MISLALAAVTQQSSPQPIPNLPASPQNVQPMAIQAQMQSLSASPILTTASSPPTQTISPQVQQVPVSAFIDPLIAHMPNHLHITAKQPFIVCAERSSCVSQVLLQPQFIKADSLLLTTLKPDVTMVTTVASPCITTLATSTAPVQNTSLQVHKHSPVHSKSATVPALH